ncbi:MAG: tetratricopeptide repeat protein [Acidobacteriota bacterium]
MTRSFIQEIKRRRVPQIMGLYFGASWGIIQFVDWLVKRYLLSDALTDAVLVTLVSLAPAAFLLAYNHGAPGKDPWKRFEKIGVPANLAVTMILLGLLFHGKDLGATSQTIRVTDEEGRTVERVVPKESFRRRLAVFFWENASKDSELDWLQYGLPDMLTKDLAQDPYLSPWIPYQDFNRSAFDRLVQAGYPTGIGAPVGLKRRIASESHLDYFVDGRIDRTGDQIALEVVLYSTEPARQVGIRTLQGDDPLALIDELTPLLKADLGVPEGSEALANDLPVAEHLSASLEAIQDHVAASNLMLFENDHARAVARWQEAATKDPSFAAAYLQLMGQHVALGETAEAQAVIRKAQQHDYKLSERERFIVRGLDYFLKGDIEKRTALLEMWSELYPDDTQALDYLANAYLWQGNRIDEAIATYRKLYAVDPSQTRVLAQIGRLLTIGGHYEEAIASHSRYAEHHPEEPAPHLNIGYIHRRLGEFEQAERLFEKASLLTTAHVSPHLALSSVDYRQGGIEAAEAHLADATATASTPQATSGVLQAKIAFHQQRGQLQQTMTLVEQLIATQAQYRGPVNVSADIEALKAELWVLAGRTDEALTNMQRMESSFDAPFDRLASIGYMKIYQTAGDAEKLAPAIAEVDALLDTWKRRDLRHHTVYARGMVHELEGRYDEAVTTYREALSLLESSVQSAGGSDQERHMLLLALGRANRLAGDLKAAEAVLREILTSFPAQPDAHLELGQIAKLRGRQQVARQHLEQALAFWDAADPEYQPATEARQLLAQI